MTRYRQQGALLSNYAHVFALITRLRQLCCHRELIKDVDWTEALRELGKAGPGQVGRVSGKQTLKKPTYCNTFLLESAGYRRG